MKKRFLSILLAMVLAVTSSDMSAYAVETVTNEAVWTEEVEADEETEKIEQTKELGTVTDTEQIESVVIIEEITTVEETQKDVITESVIDENDEQMSTELQEELDETEQNQESAADKEEVGDRDYGITMEETQEQVLETESEFSEETKSEEMIVGSSAGLNEAMKQKILSFKSKYPEGKNWDPNGNGWRNLAWECYGFVITMEGLIFKDYPTNKHLRSTLNGKTVEGWTCYYVTNNNYNSLTVEPGDILDCPTSTQWNHTAMVLSVDNGKITCVQANNSTDKKGYNLVYWTQCFNYNAKRTTLQNIYNDYSKYITGSGSKVFRLWKPSEDLKKQATGYSETPTASTLKISGQSSPGNLNIGSYWTCTGTISSNYTINQVSGYILGSDNSTVLYSKTINPNATSYSLANGEIDKALLFNKLSAGTYYYRITATDTSGKSLTLINASFTVTDPTSVSCNFSGQITSPAEWAAFNTSKVKVAALATDAYTINNFIIRLYYNGENIRTETVSAAKSGTTYTCDYDINLQTEGVYLVNVTAVCANGATHSIGDKNFSYDAAPPVISDLQVYEQNGDFYCTANAIDKLTGVANAAIVIKDEGGVEKSFECRIDNTTVSGIWSDISGLWTSGKYTITLYVQDNAGNIGYGVLQDVVLAEVSSGPEKIDITVDEEKEVNISVNTLFKTEAKSPTQKTDKGMKAVIKGITPGCSIFSLEWIAKNNAFSTNHNYDIYVYTIPQAPKITKISGEVKGCDVITYEPVLYAKTYELYRKRIGIDADYMLCEDFTDNKSHSIVVEHADKNVVWWYRLRAKADETIDLATNEKYYPTSSFSNDVYSEGQGETEESGSTEEASSPEDGDITNGLYISGLQTKTYTGSAIKQDIKVYYNKVLLKEGTDYTLSYKNNINAGNAFLTIKAKGNLTGSVTKNFEIKPREITDKDIIIEDMVYIHDNKTHKKAPKITYKGKALKEKKDFKVSSYGKGNYISVGIYTATIEGIGNFKGSFEDAKIVIVDKNKNISKATLAKIPVQEYQNGAAVELPDELIKVMIAKTVLKKDIDYTVSYANNVHVGKATLIIKGKGEYAGTKMVNFTIKRSAIVLTDSMITNKKNMDSVSIQKNGAMPKPVLKFDNNTLVEGKDFVLSYKNNKKTGTGIVVIKGKGSYTGSLEVPFKITSKALTNSDITIRVPNVPYTGKPNKYHSIPVLTDSDGGVLVNNKDYIIEAYQTEKTILDKSSNPEEGTTITVIIKGMGNYTGTVEESYTLEGISFSKAVIKVASKSYTGKPVTIEASDITSATIKMGKTKTALKYGKDYEIATYSNNLKKGIATVTFRGIGKYAGEKTVKFKIMPTAISSKNGQNKY